MRTTTHTRQELDTADCQRPKSGGEALEVLEQSRRFRVMCSVRHFSMLALNSHLRDGNASSRNDKCVEKWCKYFTGDQRDTSIWDAACAVHWLEDTLLSSIIIFNWRGTIFSFPAHLTFFFTASPQGPSPCAICELRAQKAGRGRAASCSTSASGGCCAPGRAPATYGAPSSVAASVLCRATRKKPHQRRSQPCLAAGRRAARRRTT